MKAIKLLVVLAVLGFASAASTADGGIFDSIGSPFTKKTPFFLSLSAEEKQYMPKSENCSLISLTEQEAKDTGKKLSKRAAEISKKCKDMCKRLKAANDPNAKGCP